MNDPSAASDFHQRDLELLQLVREIQASGACQAALAIKNSPQEANEQKKVFRKQIDRFLREVLDRLKPEQRRLIAQWSGIVDIESIVAEAVNNTLIEAIKNIDKYDPNRGIVMQWMKGILHYRFQDLIRKYRTRYESVSFDNPDAMVEAKIAEMSEPDPDSMAGKLSQFIREDREGHLAATHIRNHPDATLQTILLMRIEGLKWQEIADRLNISSHSTVNTFSDRQLHKLNNYFRKYLCE